MYKALGVVLPFLLSLAAVEVVSEALSHRASAYQPASGPRLPTGPVHEVDRDASAGALFT